MGTRCCRLYSVAYSRKAIAISVPAMMSTQTMILALYCTAEDFRSVGRRVLRQRGKASCRSVALRCELQCCRLVGSGNEKLIQSYNVEISRVGRSKECNITMRTGLLWPLERTGVNSQCVVRSVLTCLGIVELCVTLLHMYYKYRVGTISPKYADGAQGSFQIERSRSVFESLKITTLIRHQ